MKTTGGRRRRHRNGTLSNLDSVKAHIANRGFELTLTPESVKGIADVGFRGENLPLALVAADILVDEQPITLRGLMYRMVSAGWLPNTNREHYSRLGRLMKRLRENGNVPFSWIVDGVRSTLKPPAWSGLGDYAKAVRELYRLDFWGRLPEYVHVIVEKDAIAGVLSPVTLELGVRLSPIRGYCSLSFAHEIASTWSDIPKPIHCYYLGDYDASGFDLERDARDKITRYCSRPFEWTRLAVVESDFDRFGLLPLAVKDTDRRARRFREQHGERCAELDALPSTELRARVQEAIESHIPPGEWERLQEIEDAERWTVNHVWRGISA